MLTYADVQADLDVANVVMAMGNIHNIRGEYMEALRKYKFSLEHKIQLLGEDELKHVAVALTRLNH